MTSRTGHVADRLQESIDATGSVACIGLDPRPELLPPTLARRFADTRGGGAEAVSAAFVEFNLTIIDAVAGRCAAVKPQAACYEAYGAAGFAALAATIAAAADAGIPVVADAKRNDIGSTATHYRQAFLDTAPDLDTGTVAGMGADWLTVNGYLGLDGIEPMRASQRGATGLFVLVRTSNPSAGDLQDLALADGRTVADAMADNVARWGSDSIGGCGLSDVGAVVGATWPDQARALRARMPDTLFLVPGYGAQGAGAADALAGARADGGGVLVNSSRGLIGAWQTADETDWVTATAAALDEMNADLNAARRQLRS